MYCMTEKLKVTEHSFELVKSVIVQFTYAFVTKIIAHSQPHRYVNTFFQQKNKKWWQSWGWGETCTIRQRDDTVRQAEHNTTISPDTHKVFTVKFNRRMKLSLHLVKCLLLSTKSNRNILHPQMKFYRVKTRLSARALI